MNWTELLKSEIAATYNSTEKLIALVSDDALDWKPETGQNWMTTGQLLQHITEACGFCCQGFVTGNWTPPGAEPAESDSMLPPAETMNSVSSVAKALELLAADKALAQRMVDEQGEEALATRMVSAPWDPTERILGHQLLGMVAHLESHKNQLFYYLKLQGQPVNTYNLYGMV